MSGPDDAAGARDGGGDDGRRRVVAHLRHELRTSLTAIIGYSEHLLEGAPLTPRMDRDLGELRRLGEVILGHVNDKLSPEAISGLSGGALPAAVRELGAQCLAPAVEVGSVCSGLISAAEQEGTYAVIPVLCRVQAAGVMLSNLLEGYSRDEPDRALWAGQQGRLGLWSASGGAAADASARPDAAGSPDEQHGRVLVVDDNSINRDLLRQWLEQQGHDVEEASGGRQALDLIRASDFDVILLDLVMPDLTGIEVLEALRQEGRIGDSPIIILSASDELEGVVTCVERGAADYMTRPFNMVLLRARIRSSLELKRHRQRERAYQAMLLDQRERPGGGA